MRLIDLDDFAQSNTAGKTAVLKVLEKWEREHPLEKIVIREDDEWTITMQRQKN